MFESVLICKYRPPHSELCEVSDFGAFNPLAFLSKGKIPSQFTQNYSQNLILWQNANSHTVESR